jgi:hypothetical protein
MEGPASFRTGAFLFRMRVRLEKALSEMKLQSKQSVEPDQFDPRVRPNCTEVLQQLILSIYVTFCNHRAPARSRALV